MIKRYQIEMSKRYKIFVILEMIGLTIMCAGCFLFAVSSKQVKLFFAALFFIFLLWIFIRVFLYNITVNDKYLCYNIANHSKLSIPLSDIIFVRLANEHDYISRDYPVLSKNIVVIEYLDKNKDKESMKNFYLSLKAEDIKSLINQMKKDCSLCDFQI